ncbi:MAG: metallophosphoesterase [Methanosphaera sp.]|nr:metallophosphoesterase [Methanosphaera sp.]
MKKEEYYTSNEMKGRCNLQDAMNTTRDKLNLGSFNEDDFDVVPLTIRDERIPPEFDNYRIVHITDIHLGQWINETRLHGVVDMVNNLDPDMIAITGDYLSYQTKYVGQLAKCLKPLRANDVILSVLGNHDHWTDPTKIKQELSKCNIINLENEVYTLHRDGAKLQVAGIDSVTEGKDDMNKVKSQLEENVGAIMLVHEPDFADTTAQYDEFILQLSGHSHGGQITLPKIGTPIRGKNFIKYPAGLYKTRNLNHYTNRGVGTNTFWLRIKCPPEITNIRLKSR